jgi:Ca2+-binding RTX toxin-like protein
VGVAGRTTVQSAGNDLIGVSGNYNAVTVTGNATIGGGTTGGNSYTLLHDSIVETRGVDTINVIGCRATVTAIGTSLYATETGGSVQFAGTGGPVRQTCTVSGGLATIAGSASGAVITTSGITGTSVALGTGTELVKSYGADTISAGGSAATVNVSGAARVFAGTGSLQVNGLAGVASVTGGASSFTFIGTAGGFNYAGGAGNANIRAGSTAVTVTGGSGNVTLVGGAGSDLFAAGSGQALITPGAGNDTVQFGGGNMTVNGGAGTDLYRCLAGKGGGVDLIRNFKVGTDKLDLGGTAIQRQSVVGGSLNLNLADGTTIILSGIGKLASNMMV